MKKLFSIFMLSILMTACSTTDDSDPNPASEYVNTKWEAPDEIAQILFGGTNVQQYEFLTLTEVQHIKLRNGSVRSTEKGTYTVVGSKVSVTIDGTTRDLERSGSLLVSTIRQSSG